MRARLLALGLLLPLALAAQGHGGKHRRAEIVMVDPAFDCAAVGRVVLNQHAGIAP